MKDKQAMHTPISHRPTQPPKQATILQRKVYVIRVVFCLMALALLAVNDAVCHGRPGHNVWLLLIGALYPHLGHLLLGRFEISRRRGHLLFLADGLFVGAVIGALEFAMLPSTVLLVISLFNWMTVGGPLLLALGATFMLAGMMTAKALYPAFLVETNVICGASNWLASIILIGYFLIVARIIHQLIAELRRRQVDFQSRADKAVADKRLAERALLAVLPASTAERLAKKGELPPETLPEATLLLIEIATTTADRVLSLDDLAQTMRPCHTILERHGFETIKTFGRRILAIGRKPHAGDDAVTAFLEIATFLADHATPAGGQPDHATPRGVLHRGTVTLGLVQPERLNLDLAGPALEELDALAQQARAVLPPCLIASPAAYQALKSSSRFTATPAQPAPFYRLLVVSAQ